MRDYFVAQSFSIIILIHQTVYFFVALMLKMREIYMFIIIYYSLCKIFLKRVTLSNPMPFSVHFSPINEPFIQS